MIVSLFDRAFKLMKKAPVEGVFVEFGVYQGHSLVKTIQLANKHLGGEGKFYGFDTFEGMPITKQPLSGNLKNEWAKNTFNDTSLADVEKKLKENNVNARLIKNSFDKIKDLKGVGIDKIRFVNIDADIYEGYRDALDLITPHIQIGTVIIFDEFVAPSDYRYQSIREHSMKAIREWENKTKLNLHLIRFQWSTALCVIVDENYLKKYGRFIESLRHDNFVQSIADSIYQYLYRRNI